MKAITKKITVGFLTMAVIGMMSMSLPGVLPVHAADPITSIPITKTLSKAAGVNTPHATFTFAYEKHSKDNNTAKAGECPELWTASPSVSYSAADTEDADNNEPGIQLKKNGTIDLTAVNFTSPGQYTYRITEVKSGLTEDGDANTTETMTYSEASYLLSLFVTGDAKNGYNVTGAFVKKEKDNGGTAVTEEKAEVNADTGLPFENRYDKTSGNTPDPNNPTPDDPANNKGLMITKTVTGAHADSSTTFEFKLTITKPEGTSAAAASAPKYVIIHAGNPATAEQAAALTYGEAKSITLKHGDRVVLQDVLLGSNVKVEETNSQGYVPSVVVTGATGNADIDSLKTAGVVINDGNTGNTVAFTNTHQTITGILIHNLPFILLIAGAVTGIAVFARNRRRALHAA